MKESQSRRRHITDQTIDDLQIIGQATPNQTAHIDIMKLHPATSDRKIEERLEKLEQRMTTWKNWRREFWIS